MVVKLAPMPSGIKLEISDSAPTNWNPQCHITYNRDSWVKLYESLSAYSEEEALLLCEKLPGVWVSWVPGYGETLLDKSEFYC